MSGNRNGNYLLCKQHLKAAGWVDLSSGFRFLLPSMARNKRKNVTNATETAKEGTVRYHCGAWSEEVNSCILISYMVYL
jgi:hypothetical protein